MTAIASPQVRSRLAGCGEWLRQFVIGRTPPLELPARVRQAIAADQRASEILVCLVQFGAIATFGLLYALTPKAFPDTVPFEPIPWTLAVYTLFTAGRLWLALCNRLTPLLLSVSVVVDIAVLMLTIWSFHLQYDAPAAIYLKAPTLMYAFILIVLRCMRFEVRYVVLAGLSAGIGWLILVLYAVLETEGMQITHSYAEYVTSYAILIGAELDKAIAFGAVTLVLAIAITRARRLMITAAAETHAAAELTRFFAPDVAGDIRRTNTGLSPGEGMVRQAAVLMTDLRGFTRLSAELSPSQTIRLLGEYHAHMVPAIQSNGGAIDKYLGDGIMATFGATRESETYAADAMRALQDVLAQGERLSAALQGRGLPPVRIGAAVAVGPMLYGVVGHESRLEFTVIGDVVNLAAKLEKHTKSAGVRALSTADALKLAESQGFSPSRYPGKRDAESVSGVPAPIDLVGFA
ncbi:MAG TPA: adenylate/guanylate cyclase domain-containing protein [Gammaproteobacteria bacterium]|nr:adenylate/guanylate cyclase domain-containing protein [Gammaproteobacteria bacterium]